MSQHDRLPVRRSRFDDTATRLNDTATRLNDTATRLNDTATRLDGAGTRRHRRHFDDDEPPARQRTPYPPPPDDDPIDGDRWSTWDVGEHGPTPHPDWLVTELAAVDTELGVLKTGKEADVHLVERAVPGTSRSCLLAAKRYRTAEHRMFHRDAAYIEGRRVRRSRETRAMARRTAFGRDLLSGQWAAAEFSALWRLGAPVPYPVQLHGTELLLEYLDEQDGQAAPRLAQLRPEPAALRKLWDQLIDDSGPSAPNWRPCTGRRFPAPTVPRPSPGIGTQPRSPTDPATRTPGSGCADGRPSRWAMRVRPSPPPSS